MKLQSLSIIFIIIILPITMVLSEYINNQIETEVRELQYNTKLLNSTYDAIKAYQLNTVNNAFGDISNQKIEDIEAAATTFYNSLTSNFNFNGYKSDVLKEYVPAIVFTMYDGYYVYSPFSNVLTEVESEKYDDSFSENGKIHEGLKPYVYYSCKYKYTSGGKEYDFTIIYSLDNYITIYGTVNGEYVYDGGYLNTEISKHNEEYIFKGVTFNKNDTEELKEYVGENLYSYVKVNGKKYYLDENYYSDRSGTVTLANGKTVKASSSIFYLDSSGTRNYSQTQGYTNNSEKNKLFIQYCNAIKNNKSAYEYYRNSYEFTQAVLGNSRRVDKSNKVHNNGYNLSGLKSSNATIYNTNDAPNTTKLSEYGDIKIFDGKIESEKSNFNQHRKAIIRYVIETNLSTSIASYSSSRVSEFMMPKISETDWETIENDVCAISFLQGMSIGAKKYNGYSVVANTLTKEYIDENDIYILKKDSTYCKVNDNDIQNNVQTKNNLGYYAGVWKLNFEQRHVVITKNNTQEIYYYNPIKYLGSYTSIMGSYGIESMGNNDMYSYISSKNNALKKAYLYGLGRERWGSYNVNNNTYGFMDNEYFLKDYE